MKKIFIFLAIIGLVACSKSDKVTPEEEPIEIQLAITIDNLQGFWVNINDLNYVYSIYKIDELDILYAMGCNFINISYTPYTLTNNTLVIQTTFIAPAVYKTVIVKNIISKGNKRYLTLIINNVEVTFQEMDGDEWDEKRGFKH